MLHWSFIPLIALIQQNKIMAAVAPIPAIVDVHGLLTVCGITDLVARNIFIQQDGFDMPEAFGTELENDKDVLAMLTACCVARWRMDVWF